MKPTQRFYKCTNFELYELVDKDTLLTLGERAWMLFDPLLLGTLDRIRGRYGKPITINNWHSMGPFQFRGFRPSSCIEGAKLSSHRRGQAVDFDVQGMSADEVRADIKANPDHMDFMMITQVELNVNWVHISTANVPNRIQWITP